LWTKRDKPSLLFAVRLHDFLGRWVGGRGPAARCAVVVPPFPYLLS